MLTGRAAFVRGIAAGVGITLAAQAMIWLLSPGSHPGASQRDTLFAMARVVLGLLVAIRMTRGVNAVR